MARRVAGEGNIRKRADGRWEGRYVAGHDAEGKPIRKNVLGKTQAEVKEKLKAALEECQRLDVSRADDFMVESWMRLWYETYSKPNIREATQERYWNHIQYHIIPEIGSIKLNKLGGRQVQTMYNNVRDHGRVKKGPNDKRSPSLSASYIRSLHRMLHMALERAVKEQLILRNPCDDVILPRKERREMKTLKPENFRRIWKKQNAGAGTHSLSRSVAHLCNHGAAKRRGHPHRLRHAGSCRPELHSAHLHAHLQPHAGQGSGDYRECHGEEFVKGIPAQSLIWGKTMVIPNL